MLLLLVYAGLARLFFALYPHQKKHLPEAGVKSGR